MDRINYKKNADAVLERLRLLYARKAGDQIFADYLLPSPALSDFIANNRKGYVPYPDPAVRADFWDRWLKEKTEVEDDSIPTAYMSEFDQGLYGALVGGDIQFLNDPASGWISSMIKPMYEDLTAFDFPPISQEHPWFQKYLHQIEVFSERSRNNFGISHFILIDSLNFVFELVGATKTYLSLFEQPDLVQEVIDYAYNLNVAVQEAFFEHTPSYRGGTFGNHAQWIPGRIVSESADPFHMTSVDDYEKWGVESIEKIFDRFDGGVMHIHSNGRHLLKAVSKLKGLKSIYLLDEKDNPLAFDVLGQLKQQTGDVPLIVNVDENKFEKSLKEHALPTGVMYVVKSEKTISEVNKAMEKIREYRS